MRYASFASRAPVVHVVIGLAIFVQADVPVPEPQARRLQPPANSVKSFYNGLASGAVPPVTTTAMAVPTSAAQVGATTTAGWPILKGVSDRNKAIITGVAAGAGLSAVAGGIAIAVQQLTNKEKKEKDDRGVARKGYNALFSTTPLKRVAPVTTIATTTTTTAPGDEIPTPVWIILAILCSCCVLTLIAALCTQFTRGGGKRSSRSSKSKRSAALQLKADREQSFSRDSDVDGSMYSTGSEYSVYPSQYSQASLEYEPIPTAQSMSQDVNNYGLAGYSPVLMPTASNDLDNYLAIAGAGNWQARPSSFDPYSYAREDNTYGNVMPDGYDRRGVSVDAYGRQVAPTSSQGGLGHGGSGHGGRQQIAFNDVPQTRVNPQYAAAHYPRNELYPEEVYAGYV